MFTIDTNVLIYHVNRDESVSKFLITAYDRGVMLYLPTITLTEFFAYPDLTSKERQRFEDVLLYFDTIDLSVPIALLAGDLRREYQMKLGDSIIAATALHTGSTLVTRNVKDFESVEKLKVKKV